MAVLLVDVLVKSRDFGGETSKGRRNRIELNLLDLGLGVLDCWILVNHVIRTKDTKGEVLCFDLVQAHRREVVH